MLAKWTESFKVISWLRVGAEVESEVGGLHLFLTPNKLVREFLHGFADKILV